MGFFQCNLLEESPEAVKRREEKMTMFQACKAALDIIGDCNMNLGSKSSVEERKYVPKSIVPSVPTAATKKSEYLYFKYSLSIYI